MRVGIPIRKVLLNFSAGHKNYLEHRVILLHRRIGTRIYKVDD